MICVIHLFVFIGIFVGVDPQVFSMGECPKVDFVKDFDVNKYAGKWYEIERYPLVWEFLGKCVFAEYTLNDDNSIGVYNEQINTLFGVKQTINGTAYYEGPESEARLIVMFPGILGSNLRAGYWVLDTDYDNYSVVWSCTRLGHIHFISSWILARETKPSADVIEKVYEIIDKNNINRNFYSRTDQTNCSE